MTSLQLGVKILKIYAQECIQFLSQHKKNIIDPFKKIFSDEKYVYIPLNQNLEYSSFFPLQFQNQSLEPHFFHFPSRSRIKTSLADFLQTKIPSNLQQYLPHSWDIIGDLIIFEIEKDKIRAFTPFLSILGEAFLTIFPFIKGVFMKSGEIEGRFRLRPIKFIAGENRTLTIHKENGCKFKVDIGKAFFTPRLVTERARITYLIKKHPFPIIDMFSGVGSFIIQIVKYCNVEGLAIDINPAAIQLCKHNVRLNKLENFIKIFQGDAAKVKTILYSFPILERSLKHLLMNLPEHSLDYLPAAISLLNETGGWIHIYQFNGGPDPIHEAIQNAENILNKFWTENYCIKHSTIVKPSAPRRFMTALNIELQK